MITAAKRGLIVRKMNAHFHSHRPIELFESKKTESSAAKDRDHPCRIESRRLLHSLSRPATREGVNELLFERRPNDIRLLSHSSMHRFHRRAKKQEAHTNTLLSSLGTMQLFVVHPYATFVSLYICQDSRLSVNHHALSLPQIIGGPAWQALDDPADFDERHPCSVNETGHSHVL
jgi:hypothetical protein